MGVIEAHEQKARPDPSPADRAIGRRFEGRVAYVTEAPRASAAAERFTRGGARTIVADLDQSGAEAVSSSLPAGALPNMIPYSFSKAGLVGLTRAAAIEYAANGIRVNAPAPAGVMTALVAGHVARVRDPDAMRRLLESQTPIAGMPAPRDVPAVVAFLASDDARWVTGHTLPIDGGFHAR